MNKNNQQNNDVKKESPNQKQEDKLTTIANELKEKSLLLEQKEKTISEQIQIIDKLKQKLTEMAENYKQQILTKMNEANTTLQKKIQELETKNKNEILEAKKYAIKDQALELINIINQFEIACNYKLNDEKLINYQKGFKIFITLFENLLKNLKISTIKPQIDQEFDPKTMECLETVKNNGKKNNTIAEIISFGYKLHDYILKPATVKVIKNKEND